jgi:hypothetical protein
MSIQSEKTNVKEKCATGVPEKENGGERPPKLMLLKDHSGGKENVDSVMKTRL